MKAVFIPGDGIGVEIARSVLDIVKAMKLDIDFQIYQAGAMCHQETGKLFQDGLEQAIKEYKWILKGPTATPIGEGFRSVNVTLRQQLKTYANVRPIHSVKGVNSRYENINLVIIRENTEDLYKGIEYMVDDDHATGVKLISYNASKKICRYAFEYAKMNNRHKVSAIHKANIMKLTDGLFLRAFREVAREYPDIQTEELIVDNTCMQLVIRPEQFDVIVTENLYGDILSDLCAGLIGGLGFAPSANIGDQYRIYEAVHGSAPDIAGKNIANPSALLMAFCMMLEDMGFVKEALSLKQALLKVIEEGKCITPDIGGNASTDQMTQAIIEKL